MAARYLLDTNVLSDFVNADRRVVKKLKAAQPGRLTVSTITTMEVEFGFALNQARAARLRPVMDALIGAMAVLPFTAADASAAAKVRAILRKQGRPIGPYDALIAGCALARNLVVVTANTAEFERVEGLSVENWQR